MKKYFRIIFGKNHVYADESIKRSFISVGLIPEVDFTGKLPNNYNLYI